MSNRELRAIQADLTAVEGETFLQSALGLSLPVSTTGSVEMADELKQKKKKKSKAAKDETARKGEKRRGEKEERATKKSKKTGAVSSQPGSTSAPHHSNQERKRKKEERATKKSKKTGEVSSQPGSKSVPYQSNQEPDSSQPGPSSVTHQSSQDVVIPSQPKAPNPSKTGMRGGKSNLPKAQQKRFKASASADEKRQQQEALRKQKALRYRALAEESDTESDVEEEDDETNWDAFGNEPDTGNDTNDGHDYGYNYDNDNGDNTGNNTNIGPDYSYNYDNDNGDSNGNDNGNGNFGHDNDNGNDNGNGNDSEQGNGDGLDYDDDEPTPQRRQRKRKRFVQPNSDNDPSCPKSDDDDYAPDIYGWTRNVTKVKVHKFRGGEPAGPTFPITPGMKAIDYFFQFFPLHLFTLIMTWTNLRLNAASKKLTTVPEMRAWFGIHFVMGMVNIANYKHYWSTHPGFRNNLICRTMSRNRYDLLSQYLTCTEPVSNPDNWDTSTAEARKRQYLYKKNHSVYPVQPLWDAVKENCRTKYRCLRELAVDEAMVRYKGFKAWVRKIFMPLKPIRVGFKLYALCESASGYMANFDYHHNTTVAQKMADIVMSLSQQFLDIYHHIFCDKLYTTVDLARRLLSRKAYLTGAIKMNSKEFPVDLSHDARKNPKAKSIKEMKKTPRGTIYVRQNGNFTTTLWKDSSVMSILSTAHNGFRKQDQTLTRRFSIDGVQQSDQHGVKAPDQAVDYTKHMGGVDLADQLRSYFTVARKSQMWWRQLLYFLLDVSQVNAWVCFKFVQNLQEPKPKKSTMGFLLWSWLNS